METDELPAFIGYDDEEKVEELEEIKEEVRDTPRQTQMQMQRERERERVESTPQIEQPILPTPPPRVVKAPTYENPYATTTSSTNHNHLANKTQRPNDEYNWQFGGQISGSGGSSEQTQTQTDTNEIATQFLGGNSRVRQRGERERESQREREEPRVPKDTRRVHFGDNTRATVGTVHTNSTRTSPTDGRITHSPSRQRFTNGTTRRTTSGGTNTSQTRRPPKKRSKLMEFIYEYEDHFRGLKEIVKDNSMFWQMISVAFHKNGKAKSLVNLRKELTSDNKKLKKKWSNIFRDYEVYIYYTFQSYKRGVFALRPCSLEIELLWRVHTMNPLQYYEDCKRCYQILIDRQRNVSKYYPKLHNHEIFQKQFPSDGS